MRKNEVRKYIEDDLVLKDSLVGFFEAQTPANHWLGLLLGFGALVTKKYYYISVSNKGVSFYQRGGLGKIKGKEFIEYGKIETVKFGGGILGRPINFKLKSGKHIKLLAQLKGIESVSVITEKLQKHIQKNVAVA